MDVTAQAQAAILVVPYLTLEEFGLQESLSSPLTEKETKKRKRKGVGGRGAGKAWTQVPLLP